MSEQDAQPTGSQAGAGAPVRVALLGAGTVGAAVAKAMVARAELYAQRVGAPLELVGIAVRDLGRPRDLTGILPDLLTDDPGSLVEDVDIVIEVMGGIELSQELITRALGAGADVVTANKQLIAQHGVELEATAERLGRTLVYEAAVVAAVPVLHVVSQALVGDEIRSIHGIVNGSTNYILDTVARLGVPFQEAVQQAGDLGYLEADPTEDLEGLDAAAKIVILARLAWGVDVTLEDVKREGITGLTDQDFEAARGTGQVIKLIASASRSGSSAEPRVEVAVRPTLVSADHPFALTREGMNMVIIDSESAGSLRLSGAGAGGDETASAVLGDLITLARARVAARD
ncbi:homoserine dehydrogenase [Ornithinimicrobium cryptoxanthini]|uniref:Homoserine dehydrogenase n=1 Tax=Ornithinimicrobium cryptoxanthini TaxID=2934161 RepID=A0ABY4YGQ0_9MICO|nr:homoserine dehydrogenase [Ornithinimicrobium cryptoxanthini]USQ75711.1 homoserine dehydrogenase [Ornithinimicrobium cryptoxanthini]